MKVDAKQLPTESVQVAMREVSKIHGSWDRFKREVRATVAQSAANPNTAGCKVEKDLEATLVEMQPCDEAILKFESMVNVGIEVVASDVLAAGKNSCKLDEAMKSARKKMQALKALFRLG